MTRFEVHHRIGKRSGPAGQPANQTGTREPVIPHRAQASFLVSRFAAGNQLRNINTVRASHIATMAAHAVFQPFAIAIHAFAPEALHVRA